MATIDITTQSGAVGNGDLQLQNGAPMDGTLRFVTDAVNTASPLKLSTSLVQTTSTLQITTNDNPYIDAEDGAGNNRFTVGRDTGSQQVNIDFASNPGGSTTRVGAIRTYRDNVNLSEAMTFIEDGSVGIGTTAPVGILDLYKAAATTRLAIRGDAGQNRLISYRTGALQRFGLYVNNTAESGANAGSNFAIRAYNDAGTLLSTPLFIERSTGNVGINTITPDSAFDINGLVTISGGEALTYGLKALQLPTGIATNVISAGLSTRTGVAGESIIQMGNNLNTYYTGAVDASKAGAMIRLDTRGVEPNINSQNYSVFQIQTRAAGVADPNYTVPVQIGAAPSGSFIIKTNGDSAFGGNVGICTATPLAKLHIAQSSSAVLFSESSSVATIIGTNAAGTASQELSLRGFPLTFTGNGGGGAEQMRITAAGNVGIGTTSPTGNLHIASAVDTGIRIQAGVSNLSYIDLADTASGTPAGSIAYNHISNAIVFSTGTNIERARITANGLSFNGDTAAANALDDYEEGTWTPTLTLGGGSVTYTSQIGTYTKIGRLVTIQINIVVNVATTPSGTLEITNLPFTISANTKGAISIWADGMTATSKVWVGAATGTSNALRIYTYDAGTVINPGADLQNNCNFQVTASYEV